MTVSEIARCFRLPGFFGVVFGSLIGYPLSWSGAPGWLIIISAFGASFFTTLALCRLAVRRSLRRKRG